MHEQERFASLDTYQERQSLTEPNLESITDPHEELTSLTSALARLTSERSPTPVDVSLNSGIGMAAD